MYSRWTRILLTSILALITLNCSLDARLYGLQQDELEATKNPSEVITPAPIPPNPPTGISIVYPFVSKSNVTNPVIRVSGVTSSYTVKLYIDGTCTNLVASGNAIGASIDLPVTAVLPDGNLIFYARQNDGASDSACSVVSTNYSLDSTVSTVSFVTNFSRELESNASKSFTVQITPPKAFDVTVKFDRVGTSGASGTHYTGIAALGSVVIPANQTSAAIPYNLVDNGLTDGEKLLQLNLTSADAPSFQFGTNYQAKQYILDNEATSYTASQVSTYGSFGDTTCAITSNQVLKCWGYNASGQVGDGSTTSRFTPVVVNPGVSYIFVSPGFPHSCGITAGGVLKCWGDNGNGQLADGSTTQRLSPVVSDSGTSYVFVSGGSGYTCGITSTGALKCWGANGSGQIGNGTTITANSPTVIDPGVGYSVLDAATSFNCGVTDTDVLKCWGNNTNGQLGDGTTVNKLTPNPVDATTSFATVSTGDNYACAITTLGVLKCWGLNDFGQLGDGTLTTRTSPVIIDSGTNYVAVSLGRRHTCGITTSGILKCWGSNDYGQLAVGPIDYLKYSSPVIADSGSIYTSVTAGHYHTCGISLGVVNCWGLGESGQLGRGNNFLPAAVPSANAYLSYSVGSGGACGVRSDNNLECWGGSNLGDGSSLIRSSPILIDTEKTYLSVSVGGLHSCGVVSDGSVKCWGDNTYNQLGDGTNTSRLFPTTVADPGSIYAVVSSGNYHSCGILSNGTLKCWGENGSGQLGDGTVISKSTPQIIDLGVSYSSVSAGGVHTCGITTLGALKCWGNNSSGQLGIGSTTSQSLPTLVEMGTSYTAVSAGSVQTCGITVDGDLKCWGLSSMSNPLGDGGFTTRTSPVIIDSGVDYSKISASVHNCGITVAGVLKCWGYNGVGALGTGTVGFGGFTPLVINSGTSYNRISSGSGSNCATTVSGQFHCWGQNGSGKLMRPPPHIPARPTAFENL